MPFATPRSHLSGREMNENENYTAARVFLYQARHVFMAFLRLQINDE